MPNHSYFADHFVVLFSFGLDLCVGLFEVVGLEQKLGVLFAQAAAAQDLIDYQQ